LDFEVWVEIRGTEIPSTKAPILSAARLKKIKAIHLTATAQRAPGKEKSLDFPWTTFRNLRLELEQRASGNECITQMDNSK
jgi:hypothetical protein